MFIELLRSYIDLEPYIFFCISIPILLVFVNKHFGLNWFESISLMDLVVTQSVLLLVFYRNSPFADAGILIILCYILIRILSLSITINLNTKIKVNETFLPKSFIFLSLAGYIGFSLYLIIKYRNSPLLDQGDFKVIYSLDSEFVATFFNSLQVIALVNLIYVIISFNAFLRNLYILLYVLTLTFMGVFLHMKAAGMSIVFVVILLMKIKKIKIKPIYLGLGMLYIFISLFFGFQDEASGLPWYYGFFSRLFSNADGTFFTLAQKIYLNEYIFSNTFWEEVFSVVFRRLGIPPDRIGTSIMYYNQVLEVGKDNVTQQGGVNVPVSLYYILGFSKLSLFIYTVTVVIVITLIAKIISKVYYLNYFIFQILSYFYINAFAFLQSPSTAVLYFTKFIIGFLSLTLLYYFFKGIESVKFRRIKLSLGWIGFGKKKLRIDGII